MTNDPGAPRSRRALLAAGAAAGVATVASALGRPAAVEAVDPNDLALNAVNTSTAETRVETAAAIDYVFVASNTGAGAGLLGLSGSGRAIEGRALGAAGTGVYGYASASSSGASYGVHGHSASSNGVGVSGSASSSYGANKGVFGATHSSSGTGVYGLSNGDGATYGVQGVITSKGNAGVFGHAMVSGRGVYGRCDGAGTAVEGYSTAQTGLTTGVAGGCDSPNGRGVLGSASAEAGDARGVFGISMSTEGTGVNGSAYAGSGMTVGVRGRVQSPDGTAILGYSGVVTDPAPVPKTGVYGSSDWDAASRGVWGRSLAGRGVFGQATSGQGVRGYATGGTALYGSTSGLKSGYALRAVGRVKFDQCAGVATLLAAATSITVTPGTTLAATSAVTATLMSDAGTALVRRVSVDTVAGSFTVHFSASVPLGTKVAWHVFG